MLIKISLELQSDPQNFVQIGINYDLEIDMSHEVPHFAKKKSTTGTFKPNGNEMVRTQEIHFCTSDGDTAQQIYSM